MVNDRLIVAALLRKEGQILLIGQDGPGDPPREWALPAGIAQSSELLLECLQRTVREETGLEVVRVGDLISLSQSHHPSRFTSSSQTVAQPEDRATVFIFEIAEWKGELNSADPEDSIQVAHFWPRNEAIDHLERLSSRALQEPIVAYLRDGNGDRVWLYRHDAEGHDTLVWPTSEPSPEVNEQIRRARAFVALGCIVILAILVIIVIIGVVTLARPFA